MGNISGQDCLLWPQADDTGLLRFYCAVGHSNVRYRRVGCGGGAGVCRGCVSSLMDTSPGHRQTEDKSPQEDEGEAGASDQPGDIELGEINSETVATPQRPSVIRREGHHVYDNVMRDEKRGTEESDGPEVSTPSPQEGEQTLFERVYNLLNFAIGRGSPTTPPEGSQQEEASTDTDDDDEEEEEGDENEQADPNRVVKGGGWGQGSSAVVSKQQGVVGAVFALVKSFIGIGVLSLPFAMMKGGYVGGPVGLAIIAIIAHHCMQLLLETSRLVAVAQESSAGGKTTAPQRLSFGMLGKYVIGRWGKVVVDYSLLASQMGFCVAYIIFIAANLSDVIKHETGSGFVSQRAVAVCCVLLLIPIAWLRNLKALKIPTLMANLALIAGILWVFYCAVAHLPFADFTKLHAVNLPEYPVFFGLAVFSFEGIGLVLPIQQSMKEPDKLPHLLKIIMICITSGFIIFGVTCYISYGPDTKSMITFNLPVHKLTSFLRLFYCLGIFFTYPIMMFPVFQLVEHKWQRFFAAQEEGGRRHQMVFRACLVVVTGLIALMGMNVPNFGLYLSLIGSVCCTLLAFILPALFHLNRPGKRMEDDKERIRADRLDKIIIAFGVVAGLVSFSFTLKGFFTEEQEATAKAAA
ncbi:hypothetical protein FOL46_009931 [Perkinsus olseni]|uniref:Amino acid transporter transmembrane domain-containing protein n=1 Tax=Perkinsus olseni TaxID=32597 RepID=A0A7J6KZP7_PEROL|nr:hypothetical protein FOL46_009931 [Perkinsus olseni]